MDSIYYELNKMFFTAQIDCDATYHFFYDETNNCRKFWLKDSDGCFNSDYNKDFVLGGVAFEDKRPNVSLEDFKRLLKLQNNVTELKFATVYKGNIIKNLIMDCQSYTKYRPNETTGGIFVSWRRKEELPTGGLTEKLSLFFHAKKQEVNAYGR